MLKFSVKIFKNIIFVYVLCYINQHPLLQIIVYLCILHSRHKFLFINTFLKCGTNLYGFKSVLTTDHQFREQLHIIEHIPWNWPYTRYFIYVYVCVYIYIYIYIYKKIFSSLNVIILIWHLILYLFHVFITYF